MTNEKKSRNIYGHATMAQLVEQLIRNQQVAGSSPASSSIKIRTALRRPYFYVLLTRTLTAWQSQGFGKSAWFIILLLLKILEKWHLDKQKLFLQRERTL